LTSFRGESSSEGDLGVPLIDGAVAHAECTVEALHDGGDHTIVIGMLESTAVNGGEPLAYFQSRYTALANGM